MPSGQGLSQLRHDCGGAYARQCAQPVGMIDGRADRLCVGHMDLAVLGIRELDILQAALFSKQEKALVAHNVQIPFKPYVGGGLSCSYPTPGYLDSGLSECL